MGNELAQQPQGDLLIPAGMLQPSKHGDDKAFDMVAKQGIFLPRIQLIGTNSKLFKRGAYKTLGGYLIIQNKETIVADLTESFNCLVLGWRPKALRIAGDETKGFYNPHSPLFKKVEEEANKKVMGCLYGPEYLVYCPECQQFATFFFGNPTMRRAAPFMRPLIGRAATVRSELIEKTQYSWHGPVVTVCSTPLNLPAEGTPEHAEFLERMTLELQRFNNPKEEEIEEIDPEVEANAGTQRAR